MKIKRQRARLNIMLLNLISILKESNSTTKSKNYYMIMKAILKREFFKYILYCVF